MAGNGKGKYAYWLTPDGLIALEGWARGGLTDEDLAKKCGVSRSTLSEWKVKYPDISDAIKRGKEDVDGQVEDALLNKAKSGDMTAIIFWLANRRPDKWRRNPDSNVSGRNEPIEVVLRRGINENDKN